MIIRRRVLAALALAALAGCGHVTNLPINQPVSDVRTVIGGDLLRESPEWTDDLMIGLAFSGGGMRAAPSRCVSAPEANRRGAVV